MRRNRWKRTDREEKRDAALGTALIIVAGLGLTILAGII